MNNVDNVLFFCVGNRYRMPSGVDDSFKHLGRIRDITIEDLNYTNPLNHPYCHRESDNVHEAMILGLDPQKNTINDGRDHRISNVLFKNVNLEMPGGYTTVPGFSCLLYTSQNHGEKGECCNSLYLDLPIPVCYNEVVKKITSLKAPRQRSTPQLQALPPGMTGTAKSKQLTPAAAGEKTGGNWNG